MKEDPQKWINSAVTPAQLTSLKKYQEKLQHWNKKFSLTSVDEPEIFERLIAPSVWLGVKYSQMELGTVADFGTGPGIPGIPMAIADNRNKYLLVEASEKKSAFLRTCVNDPAVNINGNISVLNARLKIESWEKKIDAVVSRGAGSLLELARLWSGKMAGNGRMDIFKGERGEEEKSELINELSGLEVSFVDVPEWFGSLQLINIKGDMSSAR